MIYNNATRRDSCGSEGSSTATQITANILQGNNPFEDLDYGFNPGLALPLAVDVARMSSSIQLKLAQKYTTSKIDPAEVFTYADQEIDVDGDLSLTINARGYEPMPKVDPNEYPLTAGYFNEMRRSGVLDYVDFDVNISPFVSNYRGYIQLSHYLHIYK